MMEPLHPVDHLNMTIDEPPELADRLDLEEAEMWLGRGCNDTSAENDEQESGDDDDDNLVTSIYTPKALMRIGLKLVGFKRRRIKKACEETNKGRFIGHFGVFPYEATLIWEDLQRMGTALFPESNRKINYFLMALHFLKRYPTEIEREGIFDISAMWGRNWCWYMVERIQALKRRKIVWPESDNADEDDVLEIITAKQ